MKVSTWLFTASLLVATSAQEDDLTTTTLSMTNDSTSTTEAPTTLITLPPASCSSAGFESCYQVLELLTPTIYVILTADDPASISDAEPITSGDPILTQTENIATATDEDLQAPITAVVAVFYSESLGTTCDAATITSVLANDGDSECVMATAPFFTPPDAVTKTRVIRKAREDESEGKGTETGGDGGQTSPTAAPGGTTDENPAAVTTNDAVPTGGDDTPTEPAPTEPAPAPTTEDGSQPTEEPTEGPPDEPTEEPTGTNPTPTEDTFQETENPTDSSAPPFIDSTSSTPTETTSTPTTDDSNDTPTDDLGTQTSDQESSRRAPTGQDEPGKPEITTAFTTIAEVSGGITKFLTSAVATLTRPAPNPSASDGGSGAGSNFLVKAQVLFGAVGLAAVVGL